MHLIIDNTKRIDRPNLHERLEANDAHWHGNQPAVTPDRSLLILVGGACFGAGCLFTTGLAWVISWFI